MFLLKLSDIRWYAQISTKFKRKLVFSTFYKNSLLLTVIQNKILQNVQT